YAAGESDAGRRRAGAAAGGDDARLVRAAGERPGGAGGDGGGALEGGAEAGRARVGSEAGGAPAVAAEVPPARRHPADPCRRSVERGASVARGDRLGAAARGMAFAGGDRARDRLQRGAADADRVDRAARGAGVVAAREAPALVRRA